MARGTNIPAGLTLPTRVRTRTRPTVIPPVHVPVRIGHALNDAAYVFPCGEEPLDGAVVLYPDARCGAAHRPGDVRPCACADPDRCGHDAVLEELETSSAARAAMVEACIGVTGRRMRGFNELLDLVDGFAYFMAGRLGTGPDAPIAYGYATGDPWAYPDAWHVGWLDAERACAFCGRTTCGLAAWVLEAVAQVPGDLRETFSPHAQHTEVDRIIRDEQGIIQSVRLTHGSPTQSLQLVTQIERPTEDEVRVRVGHYLQPLLDFRLTRTDICLICERAECLHLVHGLSIGSVE